MFRGEVPAEVCGVRRRSATAKRDDEQRERYDQRKKKTKKKRETKRFTFISAESTLSEDACRSSSRSYPQLAVLLLLSTELCIIRAFYLCQNGRRTRKKNLKNTHTPREIWNTLYLCDARGRGRGGRHDGGIVSSWTHFQLNMAIRNVHSLNWNQQANDDVHRRCGCHKR